MTELNAYLSGPKYAMERSETDKMLSNFLNDSIARKGVEDSCDALEAMVKIMYVKAKNDWRAYVQINR